MKAKNILIAATFVSSVVLTSASPASAFSMNFQWGNLKLCTSGRPNRVNNPTFSLSGVPDGTAKIKFKMKDLAVPSYNHGGGTAKYTGQSSIAPGAFKYKSPCPPNGSHTYEWTATAVDSKGKKLGTATARKKYP